MKFEETMDYDALSDTSPPNTPASMNQLEDELRKILLSINPLLKSEIQSEIVHSATNTNSVNDLRRTADQMIAAGFPLERVVDAYASARKARLDEICENLEARHREGKTRAATNLILALFYEERRLFDKIFPGLRTDYNSDTFYTEIIADPVDRLVRFVDAFSTTGKSPEGVRDILSKSEKFVIADKSRIPLRGGSVHRLTMHVVSHITLMAESKKTLRKILVSKPSMLASELEHMESASPLELHMLQIIVNLKSNLKEDKFKCFNDAALGHLFMMNNLHYIVKTIKKSSKLNKIIRDDFTNKLTDEYKRASDMYRESAWEGILDNLRTETSLQKLRGFFLSGVVSKLFCRHKLKVFNDKFNKAHKTQCGWVVHDDQLRKDLRASIVDMIVPVYTSFLERHKSDINRGDHAVENLKKAVDEIFLDKNVYITNQRLND